METTLFQFCIGTALSGLMMLLVVLTHYEGLNLISRKLEHLKRRDQHRRMLMFILVGIMITHCVEIWLYAFAVALLEHFNLGGFVYAQGIPEIGAYGVHYVYYAGIVYTSVGFGDMMPTGALRMLSASAGLSGLILIAWSASFTYISMEKFWKKE